VNGSSGVAQRPGCLAALLRMSDGSCEDILNRERLHLSFKGGDGRTGRLEESGTNGSAATAVTNWSRLEPPARSIAAVERDLRGTRRRQIAELPRYIPV
jgi:hypothetical protein